MLPDLAGIPTLVIVGDEDEVTPPAQARAMADAIPGASLVVIRSAGHLPTWSGRSRPPMRSWRSSRDCPETFVRAPGVVLDGGKIMDQQVPLISRPHQLTVPRSRPS